MTEIRMTQKPTPKRPSAKTAKPPATKGAAEDATPKKASQSTGKKEKRTLSRPKIIKKARNPELRDSGSIVPPGSVAGNALTIVVAIMSFLACLTVGGVTVVRDAASDWESDIAREVTIQVRPIDGVDIVRQIDKAIALTQEFPGIGTVRAISDQETRDLLEPWLGGGLDLGALPVPRLILVELRDPAAVDLAALRTQLQTDVRGASLDDHSAWTRRLIAMARTMVFGGFLILILVLTAMMLSVVFATRAAMAGNREIIQVLHLVGAEDGFIAGEFQRHFLLLGLKGGFAGGVAAIIVFATLSLLRTDGGDMAAADQLRALFGEFTVGAGGYFGAVGIVFLVAVLTAVTSRLAVRRTLQQMD